MTDMTRDELKELRARAMRLDIMGVENCERVSWEELNFVMKMGYLRTAEATMKAEADAGLAVVQCVPTDEMAVAGCLGANLAGYSVGTASAHFVLNAGNKAGNLLKD